MIFHTGLNSILTTLQKNLEEDAFVFKEIKEVGQPDGTPPPEVVLIGPDIVNPVKWVQQVLKWDKFVSVLILVPPGRAPQIKQSLQFSPFVGKNASCIVFHPETNLTAAIRHAATRTRQKRSFGKMNISSGTSVAALNASSAKLENLNNVLEEAPIGILLLDQAGKIAAANKQSRLMFPQLGEAQVQLEKIFSASTLHGIRAMLKQEDTQRMQFYDQVGKSYEVASSKVAEGAITRTLLLFNDVTERNEKDKNIHAILESLPQMAWTTDAEGRITYFSRLWFSYTNQTEEQAMGDGWTSVVHPDELKETYSKWTEAVKRGHSYQRASRFRRFDGQYRWHLNKAIPVYSASREVTMWVGTSTDIHDQVLLTEELERKVKERTRSLEEANEELEQFAYISSHDLQEPLRKIHTFASLIKDEEFDNLSDDSKRYLDKVVGTAVRMSTLLKDLLSFTRVNNQEAVVDVDLQELISSIREDLELTIAENKATIKVQELPVLRGRPLQLKQLFYNLITNALKFRSLNVAPVVCISARTLDVREVAARRVLSSDRVYREVIVQDNGIGFEQQYADQIFTIFQRLHGRNLYEGTGIGLAICRKIASNHEGDIYATAAPGKGAAFHVILPE